MDNVVPTIEVFQFALVRYRLALECLNSTQTFLSTEQALEILSARDALQKLLKTQESIPVEFLSQLMQLDSQLKQKASKITKALDLVECQESLPTPTQDWWWHLDAKQVNWLIKGLKIITWTGSLGLLANIASRFLSGGVGVIGAAAVVFPTVLSLLQVRSELTDAGREGFEKFITKLGIPQHSRESAKFCSLIILFGLLLGFWFALPLISQAYYNQQGKKNYEQGKLGTAEENYLRAIALNPDNVDAHYNLGNLYEDLQQFDKARIEYLIAVKGEMPEVYNNLARLFIQKKEYPQAVALLQQGLLQTGTQHSQPEVKYNIFKNLGWARFQQGRDLEAQQALQAAIGIASNSEFAKYISNPGSAHCLLAQVLERQKQPSAIEQWQQCCQLGSTLNPDEDTWLHLAHKKLQKVRQSCKKQ
ncbi:tetratricopeptide repeat protein [Sphaerospermopsis aphanizomenoides BCCUSP55]|uniref:tetratricopeptide repeat protein n=1 Tax=Sphaerospermopsis aphanizomenoides TaxID=459663 RepID=UPI001903F168|nr:tetratricopeptide repeat protein [Sphaerospermopsis aphanizomenoides]MBK1990539.1 tetratricopeptide repeat protein [Sphaerospermopsis aphanizomenoides BCCUSP55]